MNSSSNPSHFPAAGVGFRTRHFRSLLICVVLVAVSALRLSSPTPATQSSTECPAGSPGPAYFDHALTWAAEQDGVAIAPENPGPLSSPLAPAAPPSGESSGQLAVNTRWGRCYVSMICRHQATST